MLWCRLEEKERERENGTMYSNRRMNMLTNRFANIVRMFRTSLSPITNLEFPFSRDVLRNL